MLTVYSKVNCTYCENVEKILKVKKIPYEKLILNAHFSREDFISKFGVTTFPRVLNEEGEVIGGATETVKYLKEKGIL